MPSMILRVLDSEGAVLCSATCTAGPGSMSAATTADQVRQIERAVATDNSGSVEIVLNGKVHTMPITALEAAWEASWSVRALPAITPFNSSRTYANTDAAVVTAVNALGRGINLGQMWDAITKAPDGARPGAYRDLRVTPELLRRIKLAGFAHIRLPCNWARQALGTAPYTIDAGQLARYKQDVDAALAANLKVIVNQHHSHLAAAWSGWQSENGNALTANQILTRQGAIIKQVAQAFASYSPSSVFLEMENEPHIDAGANGSNPGWTDARWESYWPSTLAEIRTVAPNMIVLLGGTNYNSTANLAGLGNITDTKTVLNAHPYEPFATFTHQFSGSPLWTLAYKALLQDSINLGLAASVARGKPIIMSEFGASFYVPGPHRRMYMRDVANACFANGMPFTAWNACGGGMDIFSVAKGKFFHGLSEALTGVPEPVFHAPVTPSGNILDWAMAYWGIGTGPACNVQEASVTVAGDTLTFTQAGLHVAYYVPPKGVELKPGQRVRIVLSGTPGLVTKMFFQKLGPQIGAWDGTVQIPMPNPSNAGSNPAWGDHGNGTYEYVVPDTYPTDQTHTETDPYCFRFQFTNAAINDTKTVVVTLV